MPWTYTKFTTINMMDTAALPYFMGAAPVQAYMAAESGYNLARENGLRNKWQW